MLAVEGGPGYSTTDSRDYYLTLLAPLRARRDLLLVDLRGTGLSGALDCPALRRTVATTCAAPGAARASSARAGTSTARTPPSTTSPRCSTRCGSRRSTSTATPTARYAGQAFAYHHGDRLRSLVLDGAYPVPGTDPAFGDLAEATQRALRLVCARRPSCAARGEDPLAVVGAARRARCARTRSPAPASTPKASASGCAWTRRRWRR